MGREKRRLLAAGGTAGGLRPKKLRRQKKERPQARGRGVPASELVAKDAIPTSSKHHTYFEFVENKDKKKKLEIETTHIRTPPPGFEFVPIGNPQLTEACKELSREKDAMIFIVAGTKASDGHDSLHSHMHRRGHHIRQAIVEEARKTCPDVTISVPSLPAGSDVPEPLPSSQSLYHEQANAVLRDLFPRIPNTDRHEILRHSFDLSQLDKPKGHPDRPVGLSDDITLVRRAQLAVLAHIRHNHTRYDRLLKETDWHTARKVVEPACLDMLVKWRGDEESGRDQLDEILREVVVISDSEESESEDDTEDSSFDDSDGGVKIIPGPEKAVLPVRQSPVMQSSPKGKGRANDHHAEPGGARGKKQQRGFKRYQAWQEAIERNRGDEYHPEAAPPAVELPPSEMVHEGPATNTQPYMRILPPRGAAHPVIPRHRTPPSRDLSPQVTERFGNLIFESIEPASPNQPAPSYGRGPPQSPGNYGYSSGAPPYHSRPSSHQPPAYPQDRPAFPQGVPGGYRPRDEDFPDGFIEVSHRHVAQRNFEPLGPSSRTRAFEPDDTSSERPAKRAYFGDPASAPLRYIMKDRGGFLEKIPVPQPEPPFVAPDPGFIQIRRAVDYPAPSRVVSYGDGRRMMDDRGAQGVPVAPSFPVVPTRHDVPAVHWGASYDQGGPRYEADRPALGYGPPGPSAPYRTYHENRYGGPDTQPFSPEYEPRLEPAAPVYAGRDRRVAGRHAHSPIVLD